MESDAVESDHSDEDSEMSFGSSHSSCETSTAVSPVPLFIDPSNVEELQTYLRTKQQSVGGSEISDRVEVFKIGILHWINQSIVLFTLKWMNEWMSQSTINQSTNL